VSIVFLSFLHCFECKAFLWTRTFGKLLRSKLSGGYIFSLLMTGVLDCILQYVPGAQVAGIVIVDIFTPATTTPAFN
jgi:hypothetical protein